MLGLNSFKNARQVFTNLRHTRAAWVRSDAQYPSLHYRYSHDIANVLEFQVVGTYAQSGKVLWKKSQVALVVIIALVPLGLAVLLAVMGVSHPPRELGLAYFGWLFYFLFLALFEVGTAWAGVSVFLNLTDSLESLLTKKGLGAYHRWANMATAPMPQLLFAIVFCFVSCAALWVAASVHGMDVRLYVAAPSYIAVAVSSFFISQGMYWIVAGTVLSISLTRPANMKLSWHSPAYTPGIELLARCYRLAFYGSSAGVALCLFPLLTWLYKGPSSDALLAIRIGLFVGSVTAALLIAVIPQWRLSTVVSQQRRLTIANIESLLPSDASSIIPGKPSDPTVLAWLQLVSTSPSTTVQNSTIAGILLGLAAVALPYIIRLIA